MNHETSKEKEQLDAFGRLLMEKVRDSVIQSVDKTVAGRMKGNSSKEMFELCNSSLERDPRKVIDSLVPFIVDTTIHYVLWSIEQSDSVDIVVDIDMHSPIRLKEVSDGLPGELYGEEGWINKFSKERKSNL